MKQNNLNLVLLTILISLILLFFVAASNKVDKESKTNRILKKLTEGKVNTLLLILIIALTLSEDLQVGFLLAAIYLVVLVRTQKSREDFESGPSPLNCKTYGDSREKTGTAFYPLHSNMEEEWLCLLIFIYFYLILKYCIIVIFQKLK